ncbi:hypothetical protein B0H10DRAFT_1151276 [Mycena sp. CBHHK59/15]|nr:hypothetical protein B0H10DRAFT_1151276 [Mycena sp. CBHHK59/15]
MPIACDLSESSAVISWSGVQGTVCVCPVKPRGQSGAVQERPKRCEAPSIILPLMSLSSASTIRNFCLSVDNADGAPRLLALDVIVSSEGEIRLYVRDENPPISGAGNAGVQVRDLGHVSLSQLRSLLLIDVPSVAQASAENTGRTIVPENHSAVAASSSAAVHPAAPRSDAPPPPVYSATCEEEEEDVFLQVAPATPSVQTASTSSTSVPIQVNMAKARTEDGAPPPAYSPEPVVGAFTPNDTTVNPMPLPRPHSPVIRTLGSLTPESSHPNVPALPPSTPVRRFRYTHLIEAMHAGTWSPEIVPKRRYRLDFFGDETEELLDDDEIERYTKRRRHGL